MQPPSKRALRPTASQPTTAEHYGEKHGIPDEIQAALQNVGRKGRMAVSQGRSFDRTQSFPVTSHTNPFDSYEIPLPRGFMTSQEAFQHAEQTIQRHESRELQPYSDTLSGINARSSPERGDKPRRKLEFGEEEIDQEGSGEAIRQPPKVRERLVASKKRKDEGSDTETDDIEEDMPEGSGMPALSFGNLGSGSTDASTADFPPVFTSPQISQPQLFANTAKGLPSRLVRGMPGRNLGKTVSAPVGTMGRGSGMDVDGGVEADGEDGFDVSEWAASENF